MNEISLSMTLQSIDHTSRNSSVSTNLRCLQLVTFEQDQFWGKPYDLYVCSTGYRHPDWNPQEIGASCPPCCPCCSSWEVILYQPVLWHQSYRFQWSVSACHRIPKEPSWYAPPIS
jgi:hypothetical protein